MTDVGRTAESIRWELDDEGVVTLTLDDPTQRVNTMNASFRSSLASVVDQLVERAPSITGVIVTSAKETFFAGGDLGELYRVTSENSAEFASEIARLKSDLCRLETLGKPVVAALNGAALGGGLEIALACHYRVALDTARSRFGLPEVTFGLMPGAGGVVRSVRLLGVEKALASLLLQGQQYTPSDAASLGIVDQVVGSSEMMLAAARAWIVANPDAVQSWDRRGYRIPGGELSSPSIAAILPILTANLRKRLKGAPVPAPHNILCAAVEGAIVDVDTAHDVEAKYFMNLVTSQVAKNLIHTMWFGRRSLSAGLPGGAAPPPMVNRIAVLGAGMMGAGIAYVSAYNGIEVVLKDVSVEVAERGKEYSRRLLATQVARGMLDQGQADAILARIATTSDYPDLERSDLVVEAVFENQALKHEVLRSVEQVVAANALLGSNTSTLPITGLATAVNRKSDFIGLHFFSPVDKMPLLEIVRGEQTSDDALRRALHFAKQIGKTPIVVSDSRGFYTSRVIGSFVYEAMAMLVEGISPASIEQATTQAGYRVGTLQLCDELNLDLLLKIRNETREGQGEAYHRHPAETVLERMVDLGRSGRFAGAGFFDYDSAGKRVGLWPGLSAHFPMRRDPATVDLKELSERMLFIEAVESSRCVEEGIIAPADANVGSVVGIGYPSWTGGALQYINAYPGGLSAFVDRADELTRRHGQRFEPNPLLRNRASSGDLF